MPDVSEDEIVEKQRRGVREAEDVLNLGCGYKRIEGAVNLDRARETKPDVVHDLNRRPWPFADDCFAEVFAFDVIEHLDDVLATFEEIHRVCRHGAVVRVAVPHFSCANAYIDPTHRHFFSYFTPDYLTAGGDLDYYTRARFRIRHRQIIFRPTALLSWLVWRLANRYPREYEMRWAWMFPAFFLSFELEVLKAGAE
ncbi:MAG: class I SAM-dependent methyltransferase [Acidobacteriota bacterium]|nr:class I SAM-dependent methyltransferase [Acidobacteriota bacterium]